MSIFRSAEFVTSVVEPHQLFEPSLPEFAFIGRSNVGKSSLINALCERKSLARVSNTPGRTQALNYFDIGGGKLFLVDLPGYGYAKYSKTERAIWQERTEYYLAERPTLKMLFLLIDSRHGLVKTDHEFIERLDMLNCSYQIILTKADKGKKVAEMAENLSKEFTPWHVACLREVLWVSSAKKQGLERVRERVVEIL